MDLPVASTAARQDADEWALVNDEAEYVKRTPMGADGAGSSGL